MEPASPPPPIAPTPLSGCMLTYNSEGRLAEVLGSLASVVDSDEVVSEALAERIRALKACDFRTAADAEAFGITREWYVLGRRVHCFYPSLCPDRPIRLFRRDKVSYTHGRYVRDMVYQKYLKAHFDP